MPVHRYQTSLECFRRVADILFAGAACLPNESVYSWLPSILDVHAKCQKCHVFWVTATELSEFTQPVISLPCADNGIFDLLLIVMSNEFVNTTMFWYAKNSIFHNLCDVSEWRCRARRSEWKQNEFRQIGTKLATDSELKSNSCANISSFFCMREQCKQKKTISFRIKIHWKVLLRQKQNLENWTKVLTKNASDASLPGSLNGSPVINGSGPKRGPNANGWKPWCLTFERGSRGPSTVTLIAFVYVAIWAGIVDMHIVSEKLLPETKWIAISYVHAYGKKPFIGLEIVACGWSQKWKCFHTTTVP